MLSAAKVRIHGMQDENWVIKDKINQYRGLIKLYGKHIYILPQRCLKDSFKCLKEFFSLV